MHKLLGVARRRSAGVAAGLILTGGMAGGVLLTPGAAYAAVTPTVNMSATAQGTTIHVTVSVSPSTASGTVSVAGAGGSCNASVNGGGPGGGFGFGSGSGRCDISGASPSSTPYTLTGTYEPSQAASADFGSATGTTQVTVTPSTPAPGPANGPNNGSDPAWTADSPPTSVDSQSYSATFQASGATGYSLVGNPGWLSISNSGVLSGYIPDGTTSFMYQVMAWNNSGKIYTGWFHVFFRHRDHNNHNNYAYVNLHTHLYCTSPVYTGERGRCTLWVTNSYQSFFPWGQDNNFFGPSNNNYNNNLGQGFASDVTAQISLPYQLRADFCGDYFGCRISGNTAYENLGNLRPGQGASLTVTFTVRSGFYLWGYHPGQPFYVKVTGSASSGHSHFLFTGFGESSSYTYVKIVPHGFWW